MLRVGERVQIPIMHCLVDAVSSLCGLFLLQNSTEYDSDRMPPSILQDVGFLPPKLGIPVALVEETEGIGC